MRRLLLSVGRGWLWAALSGSLLAQPRINEFLAANHSIAPDNADFEDYSDWIELHNPGPSEASLAGHFLTDDLDQPLKWAFPKGTTIPAGGYLLVRADGWDAAPGETHLRGYWPWGSTFQTRRYHASFKLSAEGEFVGLFRMEGSPRETVLIPPGSEWRYRDLGSDPGPDWMALTYDDSGWAAGAAPLGYGGAGVATQVNFGPDSRRKYPATHFRRYFQVANPAQLGAIRFRVLVDDGAVFYLNGVEVGRVRMPAGSLGHTNYALDNPPREGVFEAVELPREAFRAGTNVLAVAVHQVSGSSSDLAWDAELVADEFAGQPVLVDAVEFGPQTADVSCGRNASGEWSFFGFPTPGEANRGEPLTELQPAPAVEASLESGFLAGPAVVELNAPAGAEIRYTLGGGAPGPASPIYRQPLTVTNTTVLRARALLPGRIPGPVVTRTYFIGEPADRALPVISLVADPETLFGDEIGIYENQTPYPYKGREIPARVEFFEPGGVPGFSVGCGVRIGGENIWRFAQKPLNLHLRDRYGDEVITYQVFPDEPVGFFGRLNLRNGGDNWDRDMLRDALMARLLRDRTANDLSSYRPGVVFVNGRYWGIHNLRKQFDPVFFAQEHRLAEGTYDLVQYAHNELGVTTLLAAIGNTDSYEAFHDFYTTHDLRAPTNYAAVAMMMDVDSFIDQVVVNDFGMNTSWGHNREFWRARAPGARWRWNVPDLDRCFVAGNVRSSLIDDFRASYPLFQALDDNPDFVDRLLQRYAAHVASTFHPERVVAMLDTLAAEVEGEIPRHIARWAAEGGMASLATRQAYLDEIKSFARARPGYALSRLESELNVRRGLARLTLTLTPPGGGRVLVAGVPLLPEVGLSVDLFRDTPVELTAEPAPGFGFAGWSSGDSDPTVRLVLSGDLSLTANFRPGAETVLPPVLATDTTLTAAGSPYSAQGEVVVAPGVTLRIEAGVKIQMPPGAGIRVHGALLALGTASEPIEFNGRGQRAWGNLSFVNAMAGSRLSHVVVRGAGTSRFDPVNLRAAVSAYRSNLVIEDAEIAAPLPIFARFGATELRRSRIYVGFSGDGINVKSGVGIVEDCSFTGAATPDTDAIDFDSVTNGVIRGNRIYGLQGVNSDGIDVGEACQNLLVVSNRIFHVADKGISVGQASEVRAERNLIVNCGYGVAVKDAGSRALVNQNTFARNKVGVGAFEKNAGRGGGTAWVTQCIFSRSKDAPILVDQRSQLRVSFCLSDTLALAGEGNLLADPQFVDPGNYDFSLAPGSPARDAGDPAQPADPDGSRADLGAYYVFAPDDYPYLAPNVVVINEVMAHSPEGLPDWIELYNQSARPLDLGGWFLSDSATSPQKYRIAPGTILPGHGYLVFWEDRHFGAGSGDPGALIPFALSENGDSVHLLGPSDGVRPDYVEVEDFGASEGGVSIGRYYKVSTRTYNFVAMARPTPGVANGEPRVGPVVISEIMYHPPEADAEYLELINISDRPVALWDADRDAPWAFTRGITHLFPRSPPITLAAGERLLLVKNAEVFQRTYRPPAGVRVTQWAGGALDNAGETLELAKPGDTDELGVRRYIRVDRVDYSDASPWPVGPDGRGTSLVRVRERAYGNDVANWAEADPTPGGNGYQYWAASFAWWPTQAGVEADPDGDGLANGLEYALGTDPLVPSRLNWRLRFLEGDVEVAFQLEGRRPEVTGFVERTDQVSPARWTRLPVTFTRAGPAGYEVTARAPLQEPLGLFRLGVEWLNP